MQHRSMFLRLLAAACVLGASGSVMAGQPLFVGPAASVSAPGPAVRALAARPDSAAVRVMHANPAVVSAGTTEIELDLGHRKVDAVLAQAERTDDGAVVWTGQIRGFARGNPALTRAPALDPGNTATLVRRGDTVTGNVRVEGRLYRIRPLPDGSHAVVEVDESRMPADHPAAYSDLPRIDMTSAKTQPGLVGPTAISPGATATIRVMVVATNAAINAYGGNMRSLVDLAVSESNQGYANSNIGINLVLAGYYTTSYSEVGMSTDLARFRGTTDGYMDSVHSLRNSNAADVAVLIGNDASACGLASGIGSTASTAFATVYWNCATGYYSFAHEIGHLQSARHDPAADPTSTPYAYGHGYQAPNKAWRTIMAYDCSPSCTRLNFWSNPDKTYNGVPMGTASTNHNQRVLINTKATIAGFR